MHADEIIILSLTFKREFWIGQHLAFSKLLVLARHYSIYIYYTMVRTLKEDQPLRLLLNLHFYDFNRSELTYKSQRIKLLDVIAACNQLNVNALN